MLRLCPTVNTGIPISVNFILFLEMSYLIHLEEFNYISSHTETLCSVSK